MSEEPTATPRTEEFYETGKVWITESKCRILNTERQFAEWLETELAAALRERDQAAGLVAELVAALELFADGKNWHINGIMDANGCNYEGETIAQKTLAKAAAFAGKSQATTTTEKSLVAEMQPFLDHKPYCRTTNTCDCGFEEIAERVEAFLAGKSEKA